MPTKTFRLESIEGGMAPTLFGPQPKGTFNYSLGIDPDLKSRTSSKKTGGAISPAGYSKFSSTEITGYPQWFTTDAKDSLVYAYDTAGNFVSYTSALTSAGATAIGTPTSGAGNGMAYYNNYIYLATPTNISRYGPLDNSPTLTNTVWTSATFLNDANKALSNSTYPFIAGGSCTVPNHAMHVHTDGFLYICDVISTSYATTAVQGKGVLHRLATKKVTNEGDTNNGSAYDVLELPFGYWPVAIQSYGTDLAILAIKGANSSTLTLSRGNAALFLWDTFASIPYKQVNIPDPLVTALFNNNGKLYVFSGNTSAGCRVSVYTGGEYLQQIAFFEEGTSPLQGAVDAWEDRVYWGGFVTYPTTYGCVFALGSKNQAIEKYSLHNVALASGSGANPRVTALKFVLQADNISPNPIIGWGDDSAKGIDKYSASATLKSQFNWKVDVGRPFSFRSIRIPLDTTVGATTSITPTITLDNGSSSVSPTVITNSTYSGNGVITYKRPELAAVGQENFALNFEWASTTPASIILPLEVEVDVFDVIKTG